jgi:hypothetical protein
MRQRPIFYAVLLIALAAAALAVWERFERFANELDAGVAVYNASSILKQYWQYKSAHSGWPGPGEIGGTGDSRYIGTVNDPPNSDGRSDLFSWTRNCHIVIELEGKDGAFARLESPDSWDWQHTATSKP